MSAFSKQIGGGHYVKCKIQPFQYSMANGLDPMQHTIIKYVTRFRDKGGVADLKKAIHTLELLIEHEEAAKSEVERFKAEPTTQPKPTTQLKPTKIAGLPLPYGTSLETVYDLQEILLSPKGGRDLPKDRYDRAQSLYKSHIKLSKELRSGETPANIIAQSYEQARNLAQNSDWPVWTYYPVSTNFKGICGRVFVVLGNVTMTTAQLTDLYIRNNTIIQLD